MKRLAPRPLSEALAAVTRQLEPQTAIARVQRAWRETAGATVLEEAQPVSERAGTVTVACRSAVWAQELSMLAPDLIAGLNRALEAPADTPSVRELRFVVRGRGGPL
jgi:predicted nucleic acid-binding Zn ribbon protein